jgi:hypothetical protein
VNCCPHGRRTILVYCCPSIFSLTSSPLPKLNVLFIQTVSVWGGEGGGWIVLCRPYSAGILHSVSDQMQNLPNNFTTPNKMTSENDIKGLVSLNFFRPCSRLSVSQQGIHSKHWLRVQWPNYLTKSRQKSCYSLLFTITCTALPWDLYFFKLTQPLTVSVNEKGGKTDGKPYPLPYGLRNPYINLRSENSQDYAQKPKCTCTFMTSASAWKICTDSHKTGLLLVKVPALISHYFLVREQCWNFRTIYGGLEPSRIGLLYRPARLHGLAESFLGSLEV